MDTPREWEVYPRKRADDYRIGVAYPAPYFVGMSNLGLQWLLRQVDQSPGFCAERFFLAGEAAGTPLSLETGRPMGDFHLLAFSVSFELDYLGVIRMLLAAGIPAMAAARGSRHPLVVAGGAALQLNPEPIAPFIDVIVLGEAETALPKLLDAYARSGDRGELAARLAGEPYFYLPGLIEPDYDRRGALRRLRTRGEAGSTRRPVTQLPPLPAGHLAASEPAFSNIISDQTEFARTLLVEIARGCPAGCRYCWAGHRYLPPRRHTASSILALVEQAAPRVEKVGLVATAVCAHPEILPLMRELRRRGLSIGLSSLRLPDVTPELLQLLAEGGEDTIALAPETGSETLRRRLNKDFGNDELLAGLEMAWRAGLSHFRLYFMTGLPGETPADLAASVDLVARIRRLLDGLAAGSRDGARLPAEDGAGLLAAGRGAGSFNWDGARRLVKGGGRRPTRSGARLSATVTPFVPRPWTPFQFARMDAPAVLKKKTGQLTANLRRLGVTVHAGSVRDALLQWRIGMGTRRLAEPLLEVATGRLSVQDLWRHPGVEAAWFEPSNDGATPPWAVMDWGLDPGRLHVEWVRSESGLLTAPCPGEPGCRRCGICGD